MQTSNLYSHFTVCQTVVVVIPGRAPVKCGGDFIDPVVDPSVTSVEITCNACVANERSEVSKQGQIIIIINIIQVLARNYSR